MTRIYLHLGSDDGNRIRAVEARLRVSSVQLNHRVGRRNVPLHTTCISIDVELPRDRFIQHAGIVQVTSNDTTVTTQEPVNDLLRELTND